MSRWLFLPLTNNFHNLITNGIKRNTQCFQCLRGHAFAFLNQAKQNVFSAKVVVLEVTCLFLRKHDHSTCAVSEPFKQCADSFNKCNCHLP